MIAEGNGGSAGSLLTRSIQSTHERSSGGLQNSSWPMFHHDARHTGRSPYSPDITGNCPEVKWKFFTDEGGSFSSPAIDRNGTLYIGVNDFHNSFFAINPKGTEKWRYNVGEYVQSSPAIGANNVIYFGSNNGNLYALYLNGTLKWYVHLGGGWVISSPIIDENNTIYAASVDSHALRAIYPNGTVKWSFYATDSIYTSPVLGASNTIYFGSNDGYLYAIYSNGTLKWKYYAGGSKGPFTPSIGDDGSIYFGETSGELFALYSNGTLHWKIGTGWIGSSTPAISNDGTIYIGDQDYHRIYSVSKNGSINWYFQTGDEIFSSPAIDRNGIIYCGSMDGYLYALNPDGTLHWKFNTGHAITSSPVIGEDGTIYIANWAAYFFALKIINNNPPSSPTIIGQTNGKVGQVYHYTILSTDPEGNNVSYYVDWGDSTNTGWIGPFNSGYELTVNHSWNKRGTYTIKVKAMDNYSAESGWGTLQITMPLSYEPPHFRFFEWLFEKFPHAFPILRHLLGQ